MATRKSEIAKLLADRIEITVHTTDGEASGHGTFALRPGSAEYEAAKNRFQLAKVGDCRTIDSEEREGVWVETDSRVPDGSRPNVTNL